MQPRNLTCCHHRYRTCRYRLVGAESLRTVATVPAVSGVGAVSLPESTAVVAHWEAGPLWTFTDAAGTTSAGAGGSVQVWKDRRGAGLDLSQATSGFRPTLQDTGGGRWAVRFDGTDDRMTRASFPIAAPGTVFAVASSTAAGIQLVMNADDDSRFWQFRYNSNTVFRFETANTSAVFTNDEQAITAANRNVIAAVRRSAESQVYVNGASNGATAFTGTAASGSVTVTVGAYFDATLLLTGEIHELIYYSVALSDTDRAAVEAYLRAKWAV